MDEHVKLSLSVTSVCIKALSTLSQKSATVIEFGDCRRCLAVFCDSVDRALCSANSKGRGCHLQWT